MRKPYTELSLPCGPDTVDKWPIEIIKDYFDEFKMEDIYANLQVLLYSTLTADKGGLTPHHEERDNIAYFSQFLWALNQAVYRHHISKEF
jgi:hypothetical protein